MNSLATAKCRAASALVILLLCNAVAAPDTIDARVDKLFAQWDRKDSPGAAIVVVKDGAVVYQSGYGCANLEHGIPITPRTRFDVASVAKQFTGLAVAMLIDQGKLSLDDDVRKHLPDVPDFGKPITLGNLLFHTSGLRDWPEALLHEAITRPRSVAGVASRTLIERWKISAGVCQRCGSENA